MICVLAPFPTEENQKDGMVQRVAYIDSLMTLMPRTYLDISFRHFFHKSVRTEGAVTIYCLNFFVHFITILKLLRSARIVYVHSAHCALKLLPFPIRATIIFDAHGIVPEEMFQEGRVGIGCVLAVAERFILRRCDVLICITRSMLDHFNRKYGKQNNCIEIILPILPQLGNSTAALHALNVERETDTVIYAGGTQTWQNVDKMIEAATTQPMLRYTFLTGEVARFEVRLRDSAVQKFTCQSVAPARVKDFYLNHQYGFVLREEILVNLVACPTKLVEYLYWGVLPIVITPRIGDFDVNSLRCITLTQFKKGEFPDVKLADAMRRYNQATVLKMIASAQHNQQWLTQILNTTGAGQNASAQLVKIEKNKLI